LILNHFPNYRNCLAAQTLPTSRKNAPTGAESHQFGLHVKTRLAFVGFAAQVFQRLAFHLKLNLRVFLEHPRVAPPQHRLSQIFSVFLKGSTLGQLRFLPGTGDNFRF
jgi:hypothetical protein